jgi:hypothetical protein
MRLPVFASECGRRAREEEVASDFRRNSYAVRPACALSKYFASMTFDKQYASGERAAGPHDEVQKTGVNHTRRRSLAWLLRIQIIWVK